MRIYYLDESEGPTYFVRSAIGVDEEAWNETFLSIQEWRRELASEYHIPLYAELHATDLLASRGLLVHERGKPPRRLHQDEAAKIFISGLQRLEQIGQSNPKGIEVINVSLPLQAGSDRTLDTLERILNRINISVSRATPKTRAFLVFDEGKEKQTIRSYRKMRTYNPIPSKFGSWPTGEKSKNIPIENIVGGPAFRSSAGDYFIQMADFVAHALLKKDERPIIPRIERYGLESAFDNLDKVLNKRAHPADEQGVVRN